MDIIGVFAKKRQYYAVVGQEIFLVQGTICCDEKISKSIKSFRRNVLEITYNNTIPWGELYSKAMGRKKEQSIDEFVRRAKKAYKKSLPPPPPLPKEPSQPTYNVYTPELMKKLFSRGNNSNKEWGDTIVDLFGDKVTTIVPPRAKILNGEDFTFEINLHSGEYNDIHLWIKENIQRLNMLVQAVLKGKYGKSFNAYKCCDIVHLRTNVLVYRFSLKPELVKAIKEL